LVAAVSSASIYPASTFKVDEVIKTSDVSSMSIPSYKIVHPGNIHAALKPKIEYDFLPFISAPPRLLSAEESAEAISKSAESEEPNQDGIVTSDESDEELLLPLLVSNPAEVAVKASPVAEAIAK
jgi:hypothetical protein